MSIFRMKSLAAKLIVVTGLAIALVLFVSNVFLIAQTRDRVQTLTMDQANTEAKSIANEIATNIGELASAARSMAAVIGGAVMPDIHSTARGSSISSRPMSSRMPLPSEAGSAS